MTINVIFFRKCQVFPQLTIQSCNNEWVSAYSPVFSIYFWFSLCRVYTFKVWGLGLQPRSAYSRINTVLIIIKITEQQNAIVSFETINITSMCQKKINKLPGIHDCELRLFTIILLYTLLALPFFFLIYHLDALILVHLTTRKDGLWWEQHSTRSLCHRSVLLWNKRLIRNTTISRQATIFTHKVHLVVFKGGHQESF